MSIFVAVLQSLAKEIDSFLVSRLIASLSHQSAAANECLLLSFTRETDNLSLTDLRFDSRSQTLVKEKKSSPPSELGATYMISETHAHAISEVPERYTLFVSNVE